MRVVKNQETIFHNTAHMIKFRHTSFKGCSGFAWFTLLAAYVIYFISLPTIKHAIKCFSHFLLLRQPLASVHFITPSTAIMFNLMLPLLVVIAELEWIYNGMLFYILQVCSGSLQRYLPKLNSHSSLCNVHAVHLPVFVRHLWIHQRGIFKLVPAHMVL